MYGDDSNSAATALEIATNSSGFSLAFFIFKVLKAPSKPDL
jgi:hypothetical protein